MQIKLDRHAARRNRRDPAVLQLQIDNGDDTGENVTLEWIDTHEPTSVGDDVVSFRVWMTPAEFRELRADLAAFARVMGLD